MDKETFYDIDGIAENEDKFESVQIESTPFITITPGEYKMAEIITGTVTGYVSNTQDQILAGVSDVRREGAEHANEVNNSVKDARYDVATRITDAKDDINGQGTAYFIAQQNATTDAARDLASLKVLTDANGSRISAELALGIEKAAAATALESAKLGAATALGQAMLGKDLMLDGQKTRDLINDHKYHDMNRVLVERNTELVEDRSEMRRLRERADQFQSQGQWAAVQSQLQAFQSQLQTATQGTVNFGTMSGNAGRNTSTNNVA